MRLMRVGTGATLLLMQIVLATGVPSAGAMSR